MKHAACLAIVFVAILARATYGEFGTNGLVRVPYNHPGLVDIWPMIIKMPQEEPENWVEPVDQLTQNDPQVQLANKIAIQIQTLHIL